ncbi:MAG: hypothetical protein ACP5PX_08165, partial [Candidatus Hadarchaeum sp.]|uniref:hypothetical protein n=1 Tax=Candidatus Hadarchaeum sp. TaxID=2883567 RepID=UPI003D0B3551
PLHAGHTKPIETAFMPWPPQSMRSDPPASITKVMPVMERAAGLHMVPMVFNSQPFARTILEVRLNF